MCRLGVTTAREECQATIRAAIGIVSLLGFVPGGRDLASKAASPISFTPLLNTPDSDRPNIATILIDEPLFEEDSRRALGWGLRRIASAPRANTQFIKRSLHNRGGSES